MEKMLSSADIAEMCVYLCVCVDQCMKCKRMKLRGLSKFSIHSRVTQIGEALHKVGNHLQYVHVVSKSGVPRGESLSESIGVYAL